jgi:hypothetical protein
MHGVQDCRKKANRITKVAADEKKPRFLVVFSVFWLPDLDSNQGPLYQLSYQGKEATLYIPETALSNF